MKTITFIISLFSLMFLSSCHSNTQEITYPRLVKVGMGYSNNSVNATVFRNSSVATFGDAQYVAYYDAEGWLTLGKRQLSDTLFSIQRTQYQGHVQDAHNVISSRSASVILHSAFQEVARR